MKYVIKFGDGKVYEDECNTKEEAEAILKEAIASMNNDNWCGLHIEMEYISKDCRRFKIATSEKGTAVIDSDGKWHWYSDEEEAIEAIEDHWF